MRAESLREGASLALDQLRANKFRSALTILGIVVGVATVMTMSAVIAGIRTAITTEMDAAGPLNFFVARFDWNSVRLADMNGPPWGDNPPIAVREAAVIEKLPAVRSAMVGVDDEATFVYGKDRVHAMVWSRGAGWRDFASGKFIAGHDFLPSDVDASRPVVVITQPL